MTRAQNVAVIVTCLVAALTYAGAVTMDGMGLYVLPAVVGTALLGSFLAARHMSGTALILGGALALGWSELVNIWSSTSAGPAARSTAVAAVCTLIAVVAVRSKSPALFLLPLAGSVCGALLLGAGSEVRSVAVAVAVCAAATLGWIERSRRNWTAKPARGAALVLLSLLIGAVAAAVVLLQVQRDPTYPEALASGRAYPGIKPPWHDPLGMPKPRGGAEPPSRLAATRREGSVPPRRGSAVPPTSRPHTATSPPPRSMEHPNRSHPRTTKSPSTAATAQPRSKPASLRKHGAPGSHLWLYVLAAILLFVDLLTLALAVRLLAVRLAWRRLRRRLAAGAMAEQITGAWTWTRIRLEALRLPLAVAVSPDVVAAGRVPGDLPAAVSAPLQMLAAWTTTAAFAIDEPLAPADVTAAWKAAGQAEASARELLTRYARARLAFRGPAPRARTV